MARGPKVDGTWILHAYQTEELARRAYSVGQQQMLLWHRRLGHTGADKLGQISQAVNGMPIMKKNDSPECNKCSLTKSLRIQNRKAPNHPATKRLERVFMDTWVPYKHLSIVGNRHMFVIVDEDSQLGSGEKFIKVRSDGALEVKEAITKIGVIHDTTTANTPEPNAKVERTNPAIVIKARSILTGPGLPKRLWAEAMATACYLRNLRPSVDKDKSPHEI
ncbi:hypothetical protein K3495_g9211 [Podosphaera aphanis]|nr:hypothetical protein K3495_g9211 [Podosphaera aphanis]